MRTIKFRGETLNKKWVYGNLLYYTNRFESNEKNNGYIIVTDYKSKSDNSFKIVIPETVGLFTGLHDKNGKEIYDGDILRGDEYPYNCDGVDNYFVEIVWADNVCGFYRITHKKPNSTVSGISHGNWSELDEEDIKSFEVIGNIHDNPELLKTEIL